MRLLIDANILLDTLQDRAPFADDADRIWDCCQDKKAIGFVSALSYADLVYVMRKALKPDDIGFLLERLQLVFRFADLTVEDLTKAAALKWHDYEDAVQAATAARLRCDAIITRNAKDYKGSPVPAMTPEAFLKELKNAPEPQN